MRIFSDVNVHLTDHCNQNCPFCFAREEMTAATKKEMQLKSFRFLVKKLKKGGVMKINFLGGEPTLNSQFPEILKYAYKNFFMIRIYTNGVFSEKVKKALLSFAPRLYLVVNINTPGFLFNKKTRQLVLENVSLLSPKMPITLSVVSSFMGTETRSLIDMMDDELIRKVSIKLSFMTPIAGDKNFMDITDFPRVGDNLRKVIEYLEKKGPPKGFRFNRFFRPCMFSKKQRNFLQQRGLEFITKNVDCHAEEDGSSCESHVTSGLSTFKCYPLSTIDNFKFKRTSSFTEVKNRYDKLQNRYKKELVLPYCRSCPFFGFEKGKCSGPCVGFRINALKEQPKNNAFI